MMPTAAITAFMSAPKKRCWRNRITGARCEPNAGAAGCQPVPGWRRTVAGADKKSRTLPQAPRAVKKVFVRNIEQGVHNLAPAFCRLQRVSRSAPPATAFPVKKAASVPIVNPQCRTGARLQQHAGRPQPRCQSARRPGREDLPRTRRRVAVLDRQQPSGRTAAGSDGSVPRLTESGKGAGLLCPPGSARTGQRRVERHGPPFIQAAKPKWRTAWRSLTAGLQPQRLRWQSIVREGWAMPGEDSGTDQPETGRCSLRELIKVAGL